MQHATGAVKVENSRAPIRSQQIWSARGSLRIPTKPRAPGPILEEGIRVKSAGARTIAANSQALEVCKHLVLQIHNVAELSLRSAGHPQFQSSHRAMASSLF